LGGKECKSNDMIFPDIPKEYLADFIRGYFDGDGSIMLLKNNKVNCAFTSSSKIFLDTLH
jgi:intein/homing endonuclease